MAEIHLPGRERSVLTRLEGNSIMADMSERAKIRDIEYLIDLCRPFTLLRRWQFGILEMQGATGERHSFTIRETTKHEVIRKALPVWDREQDRGAHRPRLTLMEALEPVTKERLEKWVDLRCPEPGCGHLLIGSRPKLQVPEEQWAERDRRGRLAHLRRVRPMLWTDVHQHADGDPDHTHERSSWPFSTRCPKCGQVALWGFPSTTSWVRYRPVESEAEARDIMHRALDLLHRSVGGWGE